MINNGGHARILANILDALPHGIAFYDLNADELWRNDWLHKALEGGFAERLRSTVGQFVCDALAVADPTAPATGDVLGALALPLDARPAKGVSATCVDGSLFGTATVVLVVVTSAFEFGPALVGRASKLTKAESRVAAYLAEGLVTKKIAQVLGISPHTVRRHTENVLRKLEIHSRSEVALALVADVGAGVDRGCAGRDVQPADRGASLNRGRAA